MMMMMMTLAACTSSRSPEAWCLGTFLDSLLYVSLLILFFLIYNHKLLFRVWCQFWDR